MRYSNVEVKLEYIGVFLSSNNVISSINKANGAVSSKGYGGGGVSATYLWH